MTDVAWLEDPCVLLVGRILMAATFLVAALGKLGDLDSFELAVRDYQLLPRGWTRAFSRSLPWVELLIGLMLLCGWCTKEAATATSTLLLSFMAAMAVNLMRGRRGLPCGCGGVRREETIGGKALLRNLLLLALSLQVAWRGGGFLAMDHLSPNVNHFLAGTILVNAIAPLALVALGILLLSRLVRQLLRLVMLTPTEYGP